MKRISQAVTMILVAALLSACDSGMENWVNDDFVANPFLEDKWEEGKEDTGYLNPRGKELHVTMEADIKASDWRIFDAPMEQAQYAVTYLRKRNDFYLELMAEDAGAPDRVEWLVDGQWLSAEEARGIDRSLLTHFRMQQVNAVVINRAADSVEAGHVFEAKVPLSPLTVMTDAGDKCADYDSHIDLSQSVYWYLWNPTKSGCAIDLPTMTLTVEEVLPHNPGNFPEYDKLWADGRLEAVVLFGKLDDGDVADDYNWQNVTRLSQWLLEAGFTEAPEAPLGRRFVKQVGDKTEVVDIYGPDLFHSVADYARLHNWQKAVSEHEVVMYNGHSVLGTGMAFERVQYPDFYQIFQVASCLSYEYYVRPVLAGKGGWSMVDVVSNVQPTYYSENLPLTSTILARLMWGFENEGRASWQDIMEAVSRKLGHYRFGVSGARGNCFDPEGNRCDPDPDPDELVFESSDPLAIPDNSPAGVESVIQVPDSVTVGSLRVRLDVTHTYVGDLQITLSHNGTAETVWNRSGGSNDDIRDAFQLQNFGGQDAAGTWTLKVVDLAGQDVGRLNAWALAVTPGTGPGPVENRYEVTPNTPIPDNDLGGITSAISVPDSLAVTGLSVELNVSHTYVGDLVIALSHNGVERVLWNREGGSADDIRKTLQVSGFEGLDAQGTWQLTVSDRAKVDTGILGSWAIVVAAGDQPDPDPDPEPDTIRVENNTALLVPDNDAAGVESLIEVPDQVTVGALAVDVNLTHTYVGDLRITLAHGGVEALIWNNEGGSSDNIVQTFQVTQFGGVDAAGPWTLKVVDSANMDTGTLNAWALTITPAN